MRVPSARIVEVRGHHVNPARRLVVRLWLGPKDRRDTRRQEHMQRMTRTAKARHSRGIVARADSAGGVSCYGVMAATLEMFIVRKAATIRSSAFAASGCRPKEYPKGQASPGAMFLSEAG